MQYICARKSGQLSAPGLSPVVIQSLLKATGQNLAYSAQTPIKAYVIVGWIALLSLIISLVLVSIAARKTLKYGEDRTGPLQHSEHDLPTHHQHHTGSARDVSMSEPRTSVTTEKYNGVNGVNGVTHAEKPIGSTVHA